MDTHTMHQGRGGEAASSQHASHQMRGASYARFAAMIATSTALGFAAMYLYTYELGHVAFSWTRIFMAMIMAGVMTAVMMLFMWGMYPNKTANAIVLVIAGVLRSALNLRSRARSRKHHPAGSASYRVARTQRYARGIPNKL